LQCCGVTGPRDWAGSKFNKAGRSSLDVSVTSVLQIYNIPTSCCREGTEEEICKAAVKTGIGAQISNVIYSEVSAAAAAGSSSQFHVRTDLDFIGPFFWYHVSRLKEDKRFFSVANRCKFTIAFSF
jgi:hypothetical protein